MSVRGADGPVARLTVAPASAPPVPKSMSSAVITASVAAFFAAAERYVTSFVSCFESLAQDGDDDLLVVRVGAVAVRRLVVDVRDLQVHRRVQAGHVDRRAACSVPGGLPFGRPTWENGMRLIASIWSCTSCSAIVRSREAL